MLIHINDKDSYLLDNFYVYFSFLLSINTTPSNSIMSLGVKVVKEAKELKAKERVVADGVASEAQCSTLSNMVMVSRLVN